MELFLKANIELTEEETKVLEQAEEILQTVLYELDGVGVNADCLVDENDEQISIDEIEETIRNLSFIYNSPLLRAS